MMVYLWYKYNALSIPDDPILHEVLDCVRKEKYGEARYLWWTAKLNGPADGEGHQIDLSGDPAERFLNYLSDLFAFQYVVDTSCSSDYCPQSVQTVESDLLDRIALPPNCQGINDTVLDMVTGVRVGKCGALASPDHVTANSSALWFEDVAPAARHDNVQM